jgi:hypothetical protein
MKYDVFLSYARQDAHDVEPIHRLLNKLGCVVFFDTQAIGVGGDFPKVIDQALRGSAMVIGCWSPSAFASEWCMLECEWARRRSRLAPMMVAPFEVEDLPVQFINTNFLPFAAWGGDRLSRLEEEFSRWIPRRADPIEGTIVRSSARPFVPPPMPDREGFLAIPVSADGSKFTPDVASPSGFRIGPKGSELLVKDYFEALSQLRGMSPPRWRRPNMSGNFGLVTGVRWEHVPHGLLLRDAQHWGSLTR